MTVDLRKVAPRQWRFVVRTAELDSSGVLRIGEMVSAGERSTGRRADSLALELAVESEPAAQAFRAAKFAESAERRAYWRRQEETRLAEDQARGPAVQEALRRRLGWGDPERKAGEWRPGSVIETAPIRPGAGKPISVAELSAYRVVAADQVDPDVFATCTEHRTLYGTYSQGRARELARRDRWCPDCSAPMRNASVSGRD
ncbi:hypothetical protein ACFVAV_22445 [Nocardia sp. NPDC057663]|uniref:hypothetical protein n=1 Tax=Nocardia sp. NPDC057663 TaxID=3346201 RepID=UPI00366E17C0